MTVTYISTKETAGLMRKALKSAFPGTKFSVRKGTGTASSWIDVSWADGPTQDDVDRLVRRYEGSSFDGMDDSYKSNGSVLLATEGKDLPEEVYFVCCGVNTHRSMSEDTKRDLVRIIANSLLGQDENAVPDMDKALVTFHAQRDGFRVGEVWIDSPYNIENAAYRVFHKDGFAGSKRISFEGNGRH